MGLVKFALADIPDDGAVVFATLEHYIIGAHLDGDDSAILAAMRRFQPDRMLPLEVAPVLPPERNRNLRVQILDRHGRQFGLAVAEHPAGGLVHEKNGTVGMDPVDGVGRLLQGELAQAQVFFRLFAPGNVPDHADHPGRTLLFAFKAAPGFDPAHRAIAGPDDPVLMLQRLIPARGLFEFGGGSRPVIRMHQPTPCRDRPLEGGVDAHDVIHPGRAGPVPGLEVGDEAAEPGRLLGDLQQMGVLPRRLLQRFPSGDVEHEAMPDDIAVLLPGRRGHRFDPDRAAPHRLETELSMPGTERRRRGGDTRAEGRQILGVDHRHEDSRVLQALLRRDATHIHQPRAEIGKVRRAVGPQPVASA